MAAGDAKGSLRQAGGQGVVGQLAHHKRLHGLGQMTALIVQGPAMGGLVYGYTVNAACRGSNGERERGRAGAVVG